MRAEPPPPTLTTVFPDMIMTAGDRDKEW